MISVHDLLSQRCGFAEDGDSVIAAANAAPFLADGN
jgi:hypothetical protein